MSSSHLIPSMQEVESELKKWRYIFKDIKKIVTAYEMFRRNNIGLFLVMIKIRSIEIAFEQ